MLVGDLCLLTGLNMLKCKSGNVRGIYVELVWKLI